MGIDTERRGSSLVIRLCPKCIGFSRNCVSRLFRFSGKNAKAKKEGRRPNDQIEYIYLTTTPFGIIDILSDTKFKVNALESVISILFRFKSIFLSPKLEKGDN